MISPLTSQLPLPHESNHYHHQYIILLPLRVSEGDCLDMMIFVVLNENPKDCVASKSCVDQEVALEIKTPIDYNCKTRKWGKT